MMKISNCFGLVLGVLLIHTIKSHKFGTPCDLNTDCTKGLACDVRQHPITNTCLIKLGGNCHKDMDCVNGLECKNGRCGCNEHSYYERNDCIPKQIFGETCKSDEQCSTGLVCSSRGYLVNVCLGDLNSMCSQDIDCANKFKCIYGKCTCSGQYENYDAQNRDCALIKLPNEKIECIYNKDCKSDRLACDRTINGNKTFTCGRVYGEFCQVYEDCANGLQCGAPSYTCECQPHQYYDYIEHDCLPRKQFREECNENYKCADQLVCDVRVEPTPLSHLRSYECRKTFGNTCKSDNDCVNYLSCNDGLCGCRANYFFNEDLEDCFPQQQFGQPCESHIECLPENLACDLSPTGGQTKMCSYLPGARCSDSADCVHGLDCIHGHCKCQGERHFNYHTYECEHYRDIKKKSLNEKEQDQLAEIKPE